MARPTPAEAAKNAVKKLIEKRDKHQAIVDECNTVLSEMGIGPQITQQNQQAPQIPQGIKYDDTIPERIRPETSQADFDAKTAAILSEKVEIEL